ncbi:MAG: hypothetical protein ABSB78_03255 [Bacteroidota bacterium]
MKYRLAIVTVCIILFLGMLVMIEGCGKKDAVTIGELETYVDPAFDFSITYPKQWLKSSTPGSKLTVFSSQDTYDWLLDPNAKNKKPGAWIEIGIDTAKVKTLEEYTAIQKEKIATKKFKITGEDTVKLANTDAIKISYMFQLTSKIALHGYQIIALKDEVPTFIEYAGVGKAFDDYKVVIDTVLTSIRLAHKLVRTINEPGKPSADFATHSDRYLEFKYPDNYNSVGVPVGNDLMVYELRSSARQDCAIHFDVFDAKKLSVDKVFEQNKGKYRARSTGQTTIDGQKALYLVYSPMGNVDSRVYFVVKNDRVIRLTLSYYKPQEADYMGAYDRVLESIRIK